MADDIDLGYAARLAPRDAIAFFAQKGYAVSWNWWEVWEAAHARAFTVAKAVQSDVLGSIRTSLDQALAEGQTYKQFAATLEPRLKSLGWWGRQVVVGPDGGAEVVQLGSPHRLKTIFDSNMRSTFGAARQQQQQANAESRPFWQYDARNDSRTRPSHAAMDGQVFAADDPIWATHYPPNGWRCRCRVRALTAAQVRTRKLVVNNSDGRLSTVQQRVGVDKRTGEVIERPGTAYRFRGRDGEMHTITPDAGWGSAPRGLVAPPAPLQPLRPSTPPPVAPPRSTEPSTETLEARLRAARQTYSRERSPTTAAAVDRAEAAYRGAWEKLPPPVLGADSSAARSARTRVQGYLDAYQSVAHLPPGDMVGYKTRYRAQAGLKQFIHGKSRPPDADWRERVELQHEKHRAEAVTAGRMVDPVLLRRGRVGVAQADPALGPERSFAERLPMEPKSVVYMYEHEQRFGTVAHELGHTVEYHNDDLFREAAAFLDRRTTGPTRPLPDGPGEWFRPGFQRDYDGKVYERAGRNRHRFARLADGTEVRATEVISSGLEKMYSDPWRFAREEPEYFDFLLTRVLFRETP